MVKINLIDNRIDIFKKKFENTTKDKVVTFKVSSEEFSINLNKYTWEIKNFSNYDKENCFNLKIDENWSTMMLVASLFLKGYSKEEIYLEKQLPSGRSSTYVDLIISKNEEPWYLFEIKTKKEINKFVDIDSKHKQLFAYTFQLKTLKISTYYSYDFSSKKPIFYNLVMNDSFANSKSVDDMYENWNKLWDEKPYILNNNKFDNKIDPIKYSNLNKIDDKSVKNIFNQFLKILRQNHVSDRSNAFDKMINLFVAKVYDEFQRDSFFNIKGHKFEGMKFQYIDGIDTQVTFIKRLSDLYRNGMREYMNKEVIDYSDEEINKEIESIVKDKKDSKLKEMIDNLRLKKNNAFSFIEVFDDDTFVQNNKILIQIVKLIQDYKFKYKNKYQYLGDFFEELLNTSWKQEAGQFFTPMPLVDFIIEALPINNLLIRNINNKVNNFVPKMIDYASGSGHFIVSYMDKIQKCIDEFEFDTNESNPTNNKIKSYQDDKFCWAKDNVVGIEKDYRLAKTTKISSFLNGDGEALIINGDGINKFNSKQYNGTWLYTENKYNNKFDFVISNPPFSIDGFMKNVYENNINVDDFELFESLDKKSKQIEILFVERTKQLLKNDHYAAIILPRSILTTKVYSKTRDFILKHFKILSIFELADNTFSATTTSPIVLFLQKSRENELNYKLLIISSPKNCGKKIKEERSFLGYKFSKNRNKLGIEVINSKLIKEYSPILKDFILGKKNINVNKEYLSIKNINEILFQDKDEDNKNLFYLRFNKKNNDLYYKITDLIDEINPRYEVNIKPEMYIEISNIEKGKIKKGNKNKITKKIAKKGDILLSSIPSKGKIAIVNETCYVSPAIFVIRINDEDVRYKFYDYILEDKNNILDDMHVFLDGFKITYAKINEYNLLHNIYMLKEEFK